MSYIQKSFTFDMNSETHNAVSNFLELFTFDMNCEIHNITSKFLY